MTSLEISRSHLVNVADWDAARFSQWLGTEIAVSLEGDPRQYPFRPLHYLFRPSLKTSEVLVEIESVLEPRSAAEFRAGVAAAIDATPSTPTGFAIFKVLLELVAAVPCPEAAQSIVRKVGVHGFGSPVFPKAQDAFAEALVALTALPPAVSTQAAIAALASSQWFSPNCAPTALVALARSDFNLARHLDLLHGKFDSLDQDSERMRMMYRQLVAIVPLSEFGRQWAELGLHKDRWLFSNLMKTRMRLFVSSYGSIELERDDGAKVTLTLADETAPEDEASLVAAMEEALDAQTRRDASSELSEGVL